MNNLLKTAVALVFLALTVIGCAKQPSTISVSTKPEGATVFINWKYAGVTPLKNFPLEPGCHAVRLEKHNYKRWSQLVAVSNGPRNLHVDLEATRRGRIEIVSLPSDAEVHLGGEKKRGKTPLTLPDIPYGTYDVTITADGHDPWTGKVEVNAEVVKLNVALKSQMAEYYRKCIENDPKDLFSRTELAHHYLIQKDFDKALEHLTEAVKISAREPYYADRDAVSRLYQELGKIYVGWFEYATPEEIAALRPKVEEIVQRYGSYDTFRKQVASWGRQQDPNQEQRFDPRRANLEAIANLQKMLEEKPNDVELLIRLGELHLQNYNLEQAREYLHTALKLDPQNYSAHLQLSGVYRRIGKHEEAEKELELATSLCKDPVEKGNLHEKLAGVYQTRLIDLDAMHLWYPKAVQQWEEAIKLADDPERACQRRFRLALLYRRVGDNDRALQLFQQIVEQSQNEGLRNYARYFLKHSSEK